MDRPPASESDSRDTNAPRAAVNAREGHRRLRIARSLRKPTWGGGPSTSLDSPSTAIAQRSRRRGTTAASPARRSRCYVICL